MFIFRFSTVPTTPRISMAQSENQINGSTILFNKEADEHTVVVISNNNGKILLTTDL